MGRLLISPLSTPVQATSSTEFRSRGHTLSLFQKLPTLSALYCHHHQAKSSPTHALIRGPLSCHRTAWPNPLPSPTTSTSQTLRPAPHCTCLDSHLALVPRPCAWAPWLLVLSHLKAPTSPFRASGPVHTPHTQMPGAHLPQQPRGVHAQPAAPFHRVHSPICASPLAQDFATQENRNERASGEALLVGL